MKARVSEIHMSEDSPPIVAFCLYEQDRTISVEWHGALPVLGSYFNIAFLEARELNNDGNGGKRNAAHQGR